MRVSLYCRVASVALVASFLALFAEALPLVRRQDQPSPTPTSTSSTTSSPALPSLHYSPQTKFIQLPLVQIVSPNVTLFAAIDLPHPEDDEDNDDEQDQRSNSITINYNSTIDGDNSPLILPTSSLALTPNQIFNVNESLMFGFGGKDPLQGILLEWTLGCNVNRSFLPPNPSEQPWIALVSAALLTPTQPSPTQKVPSTGSGSGEVGNDSVRPSMANSGWDSPSPTSPIPAPYIRNGTHCSISRLSRILQRTSNTVTGMIVYEDPVNAERLARGDPKAKGIPFDQVRTQTEQALKDMLGLWNFAIHRHRNGQQPDDPPDDPILDDESHRDMDESAPHEKQVSLSDEAATAAAGPSPSPIFSYYLRKRQAVGRGSDSSLTTDSGNGHSIRMFGVMAIADPGLVNTLRQSSTGDSDSGSSDDDESSAPNNDTMCISTISSALKVRNLVVAQLTFNNPILIPVEPVVPPKTFPNGPEPPSDERSSSDKNLGLFFWIIVGSVVLVMGVWIGFSVAENRAMNRRRQEARANQVKLKTLNQEELEKFGTRVFSELDMMYSDDEDEGDDSNEKGGGAGSTADITADGHQEASLNEKHSDTSTSSSPGHGCHQHGSHVHTKSSSQDSYFADSPAPMTGSMTSPKGTDTQFLSNQQGLTQRKRPVFNRFWAKPPAAVAGAVPGMPYVPSAGSDQVAMDGHDSMRRRSSSLNGGHYSSKCGYQHYWPHQLYHHRQYRDTSRDMSDWSLSSNAEDSHPSHYHEQGPSGSTYAGPYPRGHPLSTSGYFFERSDKCQSWDERTRDLVRYDAASLSTMSSSMSLASSHQDENIGVQPLAAIYRSHAQEGWANLSPDALHVFNGIEPMAQSLSSSPDNAICHGAALTNPATNPLAVSPLSTLPDLLYTRLALRRKHRFILPRKIDTYAANRESQKQASERPSMDHNELQGPHSASSDPESLPSSAGFMSLSSTLYPLGELGSGRRRSSLGSVAAAAIMESYLNERRRSSQATAVASNDGGLGSAQLPPSALRNTEGFFDDASSSGSASWMFGGGGEGSSGITPTRRPLDLWTTGGGSYQGGPTLRKGSVQVHRVLPPSMPSPVVIAHRPSVADVLYQQPGEDIDMAKKEAQAQAQTLERQEKQKQQEDSWAEPQDQQLRRSPDQVHRVLEVAPVAVYPHESSTSMLVHPANLRKQGSQGMHVSGISNRNSPTKDDENNEAEEGDTKTGPQGEQLRRLLGQDKRIGADRTAMHVQSEMEMLQQDSESSFVPAIGSEKTASNTGAEPAAVRPYPTLRRSSGQQVYRIAQLDKSRASFETPPLPQHVVARTAVDKGKAPERPPYQEELLVTSSNISEEMHQSAKQRLSKVGIDLPEVYAPTSGEFSRLSIDSDIFHLKCDQEQHDPTGGAGVGSGKDEKNGEASGSGKRSRADKQEDGNNVVISGKSKRRRYDPCAICLEEYVVGDVLRELPCRHAFHAACIDPWFREMAAVCPICKADYSEAGRRRAAGGNNDSNNNSGQGAERSRRTVMTYFTPLALLAGANGGAHYWYASEAAAHMGLF